MPLTESTSVPVSTYRLQLHGKFSFPHVATLIPYFRSLGISDFYFSPIFAATPGSLHGYDVTDYSKVNPELGGADGFDLLAARLRAEGIGLLLDFVPNHMGIAGLVNQWWRDVLENGRLSPYETFFDIQWKEGIAGSQPRILVPLLGDHYGKVLESGEIKLTYAGEFSLRHGELDLPVSPESYTQILAPLVAVDNALDEGEPLAPVLTAFGDLARPPATVDAEFLKKRAETVVALKKRLSAIIDAQPLLQDKLAARLAAINGTTGDPASYDSLHSLIEGQNYRLTRWKTGTHEINYRRFFAIDSLVGVHMERPEVFRACHELLGRFVREGKVNGLRIDHIDGLRQPEAYLRRLQSLDRPDATKPLYLLVEKILAREEELPESWPVHGTTGYEFIPQLASILVDGSATRKLEQTYREFTGENSAYPDVVYEKKRMIIAEMFINAVSNLGTELVEIIAVDRRWRDLTRHELTNAVGELMANLPVYRTFRKRQEPVSLRDQQRLEEACAKALARNPRAEPQPFEFVRDLLIGNYPPANSSESYRGKLLHWVLTFQQYTGAVMAKAVEDTTFYTYNNFVALNEVGGSPDDFGGSIDSFHRANMVRLAASPHTLLATSTHDTKLSEDVRARLYVLSELADEWSSWVNEWQDVALRHTSAVAGKMPPDRLDLYRFYQILLGAWPLDENAVDAVFRGRLRDYFRKAVNEAKRHTSILNANEAYLEACDRFVDAITDRESGAAFLAKFIPCAERVARLGMVNALTQVVLKCTVPGVPDFYQGNEVWDFSLVDPDNRREVDYDRRKRQLEELPDRTASELMENWRDGGIKLHVTQRLLRFRSRHATLFSSGSYCPIKAEGDFADHVVAFTRSHQGNSILVVVPRLTAKLGSPPLGLVWDNTWLLSNEDTLGDWSDIFTGRTFSANQTLSLREILAELPFAVLERTGPNLQRDHSS